jgi:MtrB/PioB family decaheme-associated outer membrane protein
MRIEVRKLSGTLAAVAVLSVAGPMMTPKAVAAPKARLADTPASVATVNADDISALPNAWWFHGYIEAGGRFFLNNPQDHHQTATAPAGTPGTMGKSLGKYYEYSDIKPGAFSNFEFATGTVNGLYQVNTGGFNVGYDDQSYYLDFSQAGTQYLSLGWDQTPHVYSRSALTPWVVNGNALTLVPGAFGKTAYGAIAPYAQPTDIGIRRDTASAKYRWTPTDAWDVKADYSHMSRTGTQVSAGFGGLGSGAGNVSMFQFQKPVDDTTQNYGLNGEYAGTSFWGQRFTFKVGYNGSQYTDNYAAFTVQSPSAALPNGAQFSLWPSNQANGVNATLAADLPWQSHYAGTIGYTRMTQNDAFIPPSTTNPYVLPYSSLNGRIDTLLSNNVLTTKITPTLTSKLTYRYYDFNNKTPELYFPGVYTRDGSGGTVDVNSLSMGYTKQNAGAELNWRPMRAWNFGAVYGFERYNWTRADVNATNEHSGKLFADWKPYSWFGLRSSVYYGNRRYDNYDYLGYVGEFQWPGDAGVQYQTTYRQLMIDNRQTWKANVSTDIVVVRGLTLTPTFKFQEMDYGVDPANQQGLKNSRKWSGGVDATYIVNPDTSVMVGYMYEYGTQLLYGIECESRDVAADCPSGYAGPQTMTNDRSVVHTFTALLRYAAIPDKLDTELRYTASHGTDKMTFYVSTGGQFPEDKTWYQRLDASATYKFDKQQVALLGWRGDIKAKLHYAWERNSADNWANDPLTPYTIVGSGLNSRLWLSWYNPNYDVQMLMASLIATW